MRRSRPKLASFGDGSLPMLSWQFIEMTLSLRKHPGHEIWINDDLVDDAEIQALTPLEFIELFDQSIDGLAADDNPFKKYVLFSDPEGGEQ